MGVAVEVGLGVCVSVGVGIIVSVTDGLTVGEGVFKTRGGSPCETVGQGDGVKSVPDGFWLHAVRNA